MWMSSLLSHPPPLSPLDFDWELTPDGHYRIYWYHDESCTNKLEVMIDDQSESDDNTGMHFSRTKRCFIAVFIFLTLVYGIFFMLHSSCFNFYTDFISNLNQTLSKTM